MKSTALRNKLRRALARRGALLGLLAILLGQVALAAHDVFFDHAEEESCLVCKLSDRQDDANSPGDNSYPLPGAADDLAQIPATSPASNAPVDLSARGPPAYL